MNSKDRIAVTTWSFHNYFPQTREKNFKWPGPQLDLRQFPAMIADRYGVHKLELCSTHFASTSSSYLRDLKAALAKAHSEVVNMPVDYDQDWQGRGLSDPDDRQWKKEIAMREKWIDIAAFLGAKAIRPNPGGTEKTPLSRPTAAYRQLGAYGRRKNVRILIENHGGVAGKAENIVVIVKAAGYPWVGTLPDFGNWHNPAARFPGLRLMFPYALTVCHAKGIDFPASRKFDFARCVHISKAARFKGAYSVEFEDEKNPYDGVNDLIAALEKNHV